VPRVLLVLPTSSYRASDFLKAADELGIEVSLAAEEEPPLQGVDRFVRIDCSKPEQSADAVVDLAASTPIDAIVPVDDQGVLVAALAASRLGLPHNSASAVAATRNKIVMRRSLQRGEVPQPTFRLVSSGEDPLIAAEVVGYPLVVKPLSLSGSRGVIRVDNPDDLPAVIERVHRIVAISGANPNEPLLLEAFMSGPEVALEGMLWGGELEVLAFFDKPDPLEGPFFEETIYVTPSRLHPEVLDEVKRVAERSLGAIGLVDGPVHAEFRITDGRVRVVEVAARSIGGLCGRALRFGLMGDSLESLILRHAIGKRKGRAHRERLSSGVLMMPIPRSGVLRSIGGVDAVTAIPHITDIEITVPVGSEIRAVPEADRYLGFVFARGPDPETVESALRAAEKSLVVTID
jgi:biotin carboxylase